METVGQLIDKLVTVDMKMWYAQEDLYQIRHMTFEEFLEEYSNEEGMRKLWEAFKKGMDLNIQRNNLIEEVDKALVALTGAEEDRNVQRQYKTY